MVDNKQLRFVTYLLSLLFAAVQGLLILLAPLLALKGEASWLEAGFQWRFEPAPCPPERTPPDVSRVCVGRVYKTV